MFFLLRILSIFNIHTHEERGEIFLKKLTVMYVQKGLTLEYTAQETVILIITHKHESSIQVET